jgi:hypothetical protein
MERADAMQDGLANQRSGTGVRSFDQLIHAIQVMRGESAAQQDSL